MAQGLAQLMTRSAADAPALRGMGASRAAAATATGAWGVVAVAGAVLISVGGAIAVSPLAPIGPVRMFDPQRGVRIDWLVIAGGGGILLLTLLGMLAWQAWRAVRHEGELPMVQASALARGASRAGLPVSVIAGIRHALERGSGRLRAPVRATMTGSVVAVTALVAALVFGASLTGSDQPPGQVRVDVGSGHPVAGRLGQLALRRSEYARQSSAWCHRMVRTGLRPGGHRPQRSPGDGRAQAPGPAHSRAADDQRSSAVRGESG